MGRPTGFRNFTSRTRYAPCVVGSAVGFEDSSLLKYKDSNFYVPNPPQVHISCHDFSLIFGFGKLLMACRESRDQQIALIIGSKSLCLICFGVLHILHLFFTD